MSKRIIAALDVGSFKTSVIIAAIDSQNPNPQVIGEYTQASEGIKKGIIVNIDEATHTIDKTIAAAERMAGITIPSIYVTINGKEIRSVNNKGVVAVSNQPDIGPEDVLRAIESAKTIPLSQDREIIHVISREFIVDSQDGIKYPIGMSGSRLEVDTHIVTSPTTGVQNLIKAVQNIGLEVDGLVFTGLASSFSVLTETEKELGVLLLDIGAGTVSASMYCEGAISYSGVVPLGSMHVTSDLAAGLQISFEEAERLKRGFANLVEKESEGTDDKTGQTALERKKGKVAEERRINEKVDDSLPIKELGITSVEDISRSLCKDIIGARVEEILELVKAQIKKSNVEMAIPAGVVITGGGAKLYNIDEHVKDVFGVTARIGRPSGLRGMIEEIDDTEFAAAQGLIRYAIEEEIDISGGRNFKSGGPNVFDKLKELIKNFLPTGE